MIIELDATIIADKWQENAIIRNVKTRQDRKSIDVTYPKYFYCCYIYVGMTNIRTFIFYKSSGSVTVMVF